MQETLERLRALATLWDRAAPGGNEPRRFDAEFLEALENIHKFQRAFPGKTPNALLGILEVKAAAILKRRLPESAAQDMEEPLVWLRVLTGNAPE